MSEYTGKLVKIAIIQGTDYLPKGTIGVLLDYDPDLGWFGTFPALAKSAQHAYAAGRCSIGKEGIDFEVLETT